MSSLKSLLAIALAACAFPNAALAYIDNISAPTSASAGQSVPVSLHTSIYIQNYNDFGVIWGLSQPAIWCPNCVGLKIGYTNFGGDTPPTSPPSYSFVIDVPIPSGLDAGTYTLIAGIPYLVGASGLTGINYLNTTIDIS